MNAAAAGSAFTVLIPARMASSRLPDKPLADIAGVPMVVRVAQRAGLSQAAHHILFRILRGFQSGGGFFHGGRPGHATQGRGFSPRLAKPALIGSGVHAQQGLPAPHPVPFLDIKSLDRGGKFRCDHMHHGVQHGPLAGHTPLGQPPEHACREQ